MLGRMDIFIFHYNKINNEEITFIEPFEPIFPLGVHKGKILDITICPSKSIFATVGDDNIIKIWKFNHL